jgi:hypothetical protein
LASPITRASVGFSAFSRGAYQADDLTLLMLNYVGATEPARV